MAARSWRGVGVGVEVEEATGVNWDQKFDIQGSGSNLLSFGVSSQVRGMRVSMYACVGAWACPVCDVERDARGEERRAEHGQEVQRCTVSHNSPQPTNT